MEETVESQLSTVRYILCKLFPEAVSINVFIDSDGIQVDPCFRTNLKDTSMRNVSGDWVKKG